MNSADRVLPKPQAMGQTALMAALGLLCALSGCTIVFDSAEPGPGEGSDCATTIGIAQGDDDGEIGGTNFWPSGEDPRLYMGNWDDGWTWGYFRFLLPQTLTLSATDEIHLRLWGAGVDSWSVDDALRFFVEDAEDADIVGSFERRPDGVDGKVLDSESVRWPGTGNLVWNDDEYNESPDIRPLFDALRIRKPAFGPGKHVMLWLRADFTGRRGEVATNDSATTGAHVAQLVIDACAR